MMDLMIGTIFQTKAAWVLGVVIVLVMAVSILFYIQIALFTVGSAAISLVKNFVEKFSHRKPARITNGLIWNRAELGLTMPDGGEPLAAEGKKEKES